MKRAVILLAAVAAGVWIAARERRGGEESPPPPAAAPVTMAQAPIAQPAAAAPAAPAAAPMAPAALRSFSWRPAMDASSRPVPAAALRQERRPATREEALAAVREQVAADSRLSPFLRAAHEIHLAPAKEEQLTAFLRTRMMAEPQRGTEHGRALAPQELMLERSQRLRQMLGPLASILGPDTGRLVVAAMRPSPQDFHLGTPLPGFGGR